MDADPVKKRIRWGVFLPSWIIAVFILILNLVNYDLFLVTMDGAVDWILVNFSWLFNSTVFFALIIVVVVYFSPLKNIRFGGSKSKPVLGYTNFVWIVLCTIMGSGLMLWAIAEPMNHLHHPPANVIAGPLSGESIMWCMENILLEWTFSPMAIYALPTLLFAFVFYNMKKPFAIGSMLTPLFPGKRGLENSIAPKVTPVVDSVCMLSLSMVMAASLGVGILLISGGVTEVAGDVIPGEKVLLVIVGAFIMGTAIISASSGLMRGIRTLSIINVYFYLILGITVFLFGPTTYLLDLCVESLGAYLSDFFKISLWTSTAWGDGWSRLWPTFYWCVWMGWMPISIVFLGRISKGYTVREVLNAVFVIPAIFSVLWLVLFSGTAINFELAGLGIYDAMQTGGAAAAVYAVLGHLPLPKLIIPLFLITAVLSFITSCDSNTNAIAGLCTKGLTTDDTESPVTPKIVWGITIGAVSVIMLLTYDLEGVKMLSYLAGFPGEILMLLFIISFIKIMSNPKKYDLYKEDYDEKGRPLSFSKP